MATPRLKFTIYKMYFYFLFYMNECIQKVNRPSQPSSASSISNHAELPQSSSSSTLDSNGSACCSSQRGWWEQKLPSTLVVTLYEGYRVMGHLGFSQGCSQDKSCSYRCLSSVILVKPLALKPGRRSLLKATHGHRGRPLCD